MYYSISFKKKNKWEKFKKECDSKKNTILTWFKNLGKNLNNISNICVDRLKYIAFILGRLSILLITILPFLIFGMVCVWVLIYLVCLIATWCNCDWTSFATWKYFPAIINPKVQKGSMLALFLVNAFFAWFSGYSLYILWQTAKQTLNKELKSSWTFFKCHWSLTLLQVGLIFVMYHRSWINNICLWTDRILTAIIVIFILGGIISLFQSNNKEEIIAIIRLKK